MDTYELFDKMHRDPGDYGLFRRIYEVLQLAPSQRHSDQEALASLTCDALDYLRTDGQWMTASPLGRTTMRLHGSRLVVEEDNDRDWEFQRHYPIG